jgi:glutaredoxin-related protein
MRQTLPSEQLSESARQSIENFHNDVVDKVKAAVKANQIVVVGMAQNPFVKKARTILTERKMDFQYLEFGSYFSMWKQRLAIKIWSGWPTFPQVFVGGRLVGGFKELNEYLNKQSN